VWTSCTGDVSVHSCASLTTPWRLKSVAWKYAVHLICQVNWMDWIVELHFACKHAEHFLRAQWIKRYITWSHDSSLRIWHRCIFSDCWNRFVELSANLGVKAICAHGRITEVVEGQWSLNPRCIILINPRCIMRRCWQMYRNWMCSQCSMPERKWVSLRQVFLKATTDKTNRNWPVQ